MYRSTPYLETMLFKVPKIGGITLFIRYYYFYIIYWVITDGFLADFQCKESANRNTLKQYFFADIRLILL
jgi:hypothetical protein